MRPKKILVIDTNKYYLPLKDYSKDNLKIEYCGCDHNLVEQIFNNESIDAVVLNVDSLPINGPENPLNLALKTGIKHKNVKIFLKSYYEPYMDKLKSDVSIMANYEEFGDLKNNIYIHSKYDGSIALIDKIYSNLKI